MTTNRPRKAKTTDLVCDCYRGKIHNFSKFDWRRSGAEHRHVVGEDTKSVAGQAVLPRTRILYGQLQVTTEDEAYQVLRLPGTKERRIYDQRGKNILDC